MEKESVGAERVAIEVGTERVASEVLLALKELPLKLALKELPVMDVCGSSSAVGRHVSD